MSCHKMYMYSKSLGLAITSGNTCEVSTKSLSGGWKPYVDYNLWAFVHEYV